MDEYIRILILDYFKRSKTNYSFINLAKMLGFSTDKLQGCIEELVERGELGYIENLLTVTEEGETKICFVSSGANDSLGVEFEINRVWMVDEIYTPQNFTESRMDI